MSAMSVCNTPCFIIPGTQGEVDTSEERQRELIRQRLKEKGVSQSSEYLCIHHCTYVCTQCTYSVHAQSCSNQWCYIMYVHMYATD